MLVWFFLICYRFEVIFLFPHSEPFPIELPDGLNLWDSQEGFFSNKERRNEAVSHPDRRKESAIN